MFVCNLKLDHKLLFKILFVLIFICVLAVSAISIYKVFNYQTINDTIPTPEISKITSDNYTNILKTVHDNLDEYIGQKINFTGFIYRVYDFQETQFVLARNMIVSSDNQTVVVGFLCDYKKANEFQDNSWVNITGTITKGDYHGDIPIIEITNIDKCDKPTDEYVYPPDDTFIPTSALF